MIPEKPPVLSYFIQVLLSRLETANYSDLLWNIDRQEDVLINELNAANEKINNKMKVAGGYNVGCQFHTERDEEGVGTTDEGGTRQGLERDKVTLCSDVVDDIRVSMALLAIVRQVSGAHSSVDLLPFGKTVRQAGMSSAGKGISTFK